MLIRKLVQLWALTKWPWGHSITGSTGGACLSKDLRIDSVPGWVLQMKGHTPRKPQPPRCPWPGCSLEDPRSRCSWCCRRMPCWLKPEQLRGEIVRLQNKAAVDPRMKQKACKVENSQAGATPVILNYHDLQLSCPSAKNEQKWHRDRRTENSGRIQGTLWRGQI